MVAFSNNFGVIDQLKIIADIVKKMGRSTTLPVSKPRAWAEINLNHLRHNLKELKRVLPDTCDMMAVVKANAYGHGGPEVAKFLAGEGVRYFAVAAYSEGIALRKQGVFVEILVLGYTPPEAFSELVRYRLIQTVVSVDYAEELNRFGRKHGEKMNVHIKIDSGMSRLGVLYDNIEPICSMYKQSNLQVTGIYSHLSMSDSQKEEDILYTNQQIDRYHQVIEQIRKAGLEPGMLHIQSSYGILNYPADGYSLARPGIALYGLLSKEDDRPNVKIHLRPVLSLKASVVQVKTIQAETPVGYGRNYVPNQTSRIAVVSIGYADGISRALFEQDGFVLVRGRKANIVGNICMDQMMIDVTHIEGVQAGDTVTLIGQDGKETITAGQIARRSGTVTNEVLSGIGERVERVYRN
ncbi:MULTISPECIES: serine racemase VanT catalytic subunit [Paenibacillus]|nr:serine racemase VanT catalytic subunit [Paenibacillus lautus]